MQRIVARARHTQLKMSQDNKSQIGSVGRCTLWRASVCALAIVAAASMTITLARASPDAQQRAGTCRRELESANRTLSDWAKRMEDMVMESNLSASTRDLVHNEANKILDMIEEFGEQIGVRPPSVLARNLVQIRRRSNKMALDVYLNTFDMRWPQNSLQLGIIVERVQQACLDRITINALEAAPSPLAESLGITSTSKPRAAKRA